VFPAWEGCQWISEIRLVKEKHPNKVNVIIRLIFCIKFNILMSGVYFVQL
jgi:hypothetical protein